MCLGTTWFPLESDGNTAVCDRQRKIADPSEHLWAEGLEFLDILVARSSYAENSTTPAVSSIEDPLELSCPGIHRPSLGEYLIDLIKQHSRSPLLDGSEEGG